MAPVKRYEYDVEEIGPYDRTVLEAAEKAMLPVRGKAGWHLSAVVETGIPNVPYQRTRRYYFARLLKPEVFPPG